MSVKIYLNTEGSCIFKAGETIIDTMPKGSLSLRLEGDRMLFLRTLSGVIFQDYAVLEVQNEDGAAYGTYEDILAGLPNFFVSASGDGGSTSVTSVNGATGDVTINKTTVALGNVDNTSDANKPISTATQTAISAENAAMVAKIALCLKTTQLGVSNGVASLDGTGQLTASQIPNSLLAGLKWKGVWNATTNTPTLSSTPSANGEFYRTSVAGTSSALTGSSVTYGVGDWLISNGTSWQVVVNTFNDATTVSKGVIQLTGDLAGGAASPLVAKLGGVSIPAAAPTAAGKYLRSTGVAATEYASIPATDLPSATTAAKGVLQLGGDLAGNSTAQTVAKVNGWSIGTEPTMVNQVLAVTDIGSKTLGYVSQTGGGGVAASYMRATSTAPQPGTPAIGTMLLITDVSTSVGSDVTLSASVFTLKAGKTYRLQGTVGAMHITGIGQYQWRTGSVGGAGTLIGDPGAIVSVNTAINYNATCPFAEAIYTPSTDTQVHLEIISGSGFVAAGFTGLGFPSAFIEVIAGSAPITGQSVDYIFARNNTTQSITTAANQVVVINTTLEGGMTLSGNSITLLAGKTYELEGSVGSVSASNTSTAFQWRNTTSGAFIGTLGIRYPATYAASFANSQLNAKCVITPTVTTTVQLWIVANTVAGTIGAGDFSDFPYVIVKQLGTSSVINMIGATATTQGVAGTVPAPAVGKQNAVLKGDGTWFSRAYGSSFVRANTASFITTYPLSASTDTFVACGTVTTNASVNLTASSTILTFTVITSGTYKVSGGSTITNTVGPNWSRTILTKNGVGTYLSVSPNSWVSSLSAGVSSNTETIVSLVAGDVVSCCAWSQYAGHMQGGYLTLEQIN